jgi:hypothetical protein
MHGGNGLLELVARNMAPAAIGEQVVAFVEIFLKKSDPAKFQGSFGGEDFIVFYRLGAACKADDERENGQTRSLPSS